MLPLRVGKLIGLCFRDCERDRDCVACFRSDRRDLHFIELAHLPLLTSWWFSNVARLLSPFRPWVGTLEELHFRQDVTEMLSMVTLLAALLYPGAAWQGQCSAAEHRGHVREPGLAQQRRSAADTLR